MMVLIFNPYSTDILISFESCPSLRAFYSLIFCTIPVVAVVYI